MNLDLEGRIFYSFPDQTFLIETSEGNFTYKEKWNSDNITLHRTELSQTDFVKVPPYYPKYMETTKLRDYFENFNVSISEA